MQCTVVDFKTIGQTINSCAAEHTVYIRAVCRCSGVYQNPLWVQPYAEWQEESQSQEIVM